MACTASWRRVKSFRSLAEVRPPPLHAEALAQSLFKSERSARHRAKVNPLQVTPVIVLWGPPNTTFPPTPASTASSSLLGDACFPGWRNSVLNQSHEQPRATSSIVSRRIGAIPGPPTLDLGAAGEWPDLRLSRSSPGNAFGSAKREQRTSFPLVLVERPDSLSTHRGTSGAAGLRSWDRLAARERALGRVLPLSPRSSGDRAVPSGGMCAGSIPAGGALRNPFTLPAPRGCEPGRGRPQPRRDGCRTGARRCPASWSLRHGPASAGRP